MTPSTRSIPVQVFIALAIIFSTLLLGGVLAWKNYHSVQQIMLSAAGDSAQEFGRTINERARRLINPVQSTIRLLSHDPIAQAGNLQQRLERLPALIESLNTNQMLSAIYVGYPNSEFILLRRLDAELKQRFAAPAASAFLVQSMSLGTANEMIGEWHFYSREIALLQTEVKSDYRFDPRDRTWYTETIDQSSTTMTPPYVFFTTREAGMTLAQRSISGTAIIGMDVSIGDLNNAVRDLRMTPGTKIVILDDGGNVIVHPNSQRLLRAQDDADLRLPHVSELGEASLTQLFETPPQDNAPRLYRVNGEKWYGMLAPLSNFTEHDTQLLISVPASEMLTDARHALVEEGIWLAALTALLLLIGWILSQRISRPLRVLTEQVSTLSDFDFSRNIGVQSRISEIRKLSQVLGSMSKTINNFQAITFTLSHETQLDSMLGKVLEGLVQATGASSGAVYLHDDDSGVLKLATSDQNETYPEELRLAVHNQTNLAATIAQALESQMHYLPVVLNNRNQELLGILVLQLDPEHEPTGSQRQPFRHFVEELSGAAAVAIETRQLIEAQQRLLDAIIKLLANAIDAKSPYTGAHCERVPDLAELLLDQVIHADSGPYADFDMTDAQRYEFRIAAWLHDCGKVTSPESVMDKATKLETQYNRIHEIRTRFEVLWRDAEIAFWQGLAQGGDENALKLALSRTHADLQEEFTIIANANIGGEFMDDDDIGRIKQIGARRWWRHFDNRLGLAHHEAGRLPASTATPLPTEERLLSDRPEHLVHWKERKPPVDKNDPDNLWGFDMDIPAYAYNYGELYNLSVRRGTLTPEERFKINEHIVQTIIMLHSLPLPSHLKRVPSIAGNHHEKMDGSGYPRRLNKDDMGIAERVMTIADIFEALTAADRPYKTAKTLSESIGILANMARDQHIDPELFRLFLTSGVYLKYSEKYLSPEQIDEVHVERYLDMLDAPAHDVGKPVMH